MTAYQCTTAAHVSLPLAVLHTQQRWIRGDDKTVPGSTFLVDGGYHARRRLEPLRTSLHMFFCTYDFARYNTIS